MVCLRYIWRGERSDRLMHVKFRLSQNRFNLSKQFNTTAEIVCILKTEKLPLLQIKFPKMNKTKFSIQNFIMIYHYYYCLSHKLKSRLSTGIWGCDFFVLKYSLNNFQTSLPMMAVSCFA